MMSTTLFAAQRQSAARGYLGSKVPTRIKKRVEIWVSEEQRLSMSTSIVAESEQLLGLVRMAALPHEEQYYTLRKASYTKALAEDIYPALSSRARALHGLATCQERCCTDVAFGSPL